MLSKYRKLDIFEDLESEVENSNCGIYKITNLKNNKGYIGQSSDIKKRWRNHKFELKNNIHNNPYLQNAFNKYGEEAFEFRIIEKTLIILIQQILKKVIISNMVETLLK